VSFQPVGIENENKKPIKQSLTVSPLNSTENFTRYTPTLVVKIGDELIKEDMMSKSAQSKDSKKDALVNAAGIVMPQAMESLSWQPIDYLDNSNVNSLDGTHNKRENSRSLGTPITTFAVQDRTSVNHSVSEVNTNSTAFKQNISSSLNWSEMVSDRPNIKESVLIHSSTSGPSAWPREASATRSTKDLLAKINSTSDSHRHSKSEIGEPVLNPKTTMPPRSKLVKAREISSTVPGNHHEHNMKWMPALDLNPPPIGNGQTWQHWATETTASNIASLVTEEPVLEEKSYDKLASVKDANGEGRKLTVSSRTTNSKKTHLLPVTIQFFPHRLAAILAQAERYARLTFSFPIAAISKLGYYTSPSTAPPEDDQDTSASTNTLYKINSQFLLESQEDSTRRNPGFQTQRRPKHFTTARPTVANVNTKPSSQSASSGSEELHVNNGKTDAAPVTAEAPYHSQVKDVPLLQQRYDSFGSSHQMKETQKLHIFVPYTYAYVSDDGQEGTDDTEMPRYIPLLRYPYVTPRNSKYDIWQSYSRSSSNNNQNSSEKPEASIKVKQFSDSKNGDTDYSNFFSIFNQSPAMRER
jgi:hypothetical protein